MSSISKSLETMLEEIHKDGDVSMDEYKRLQTEADRRWIAVTEELGPNTTLTAFQSAMDVAMHLLYLSVEHVQKQEVTDLGEAYVKDAVHAQVEYLRAGTELTLKLLRAGQNRL